MPSPVQPEGQHRAGHGNRTEKIGISERHARASVVWAKLRSPFVNTAMAST
jgi:hypothetical protein